MKIRLLFSFLLLNYFNSLSQEVLWATKVLEKSSETADEAYSPKYRGIQILGKPNVLPQIVSSPCSWRPTGSGFGEDYIKVGFDKAIKIRQIIVGETVNPGAIGRIFGYTPSNQEILLFENTQPAPRQSGRIWNVIIPETAQEISSIKLLIVHQLSKGMKEIDAVGISNSETPFTAKINVAPNIPGDLQKDNLGPNINSKFGEVAPLVSPDGKNLYFTRLNHPENFTQKSGKNERANEIQQDIWVSKLSKNGMWEQAQNIGEPLNNPQNNAAATISADGKSLFVLNVYLPNGRFVAGLSKATLKNKKWELPKQIRINDFQALEYYDEKLKLKTTVTEYAISSDEKYLIMGLKRNETYGDKDLYVSFKNNDESYSRPVNLGSIINSAGNEGSPFLAADNKTLYFNSNGHPAYGDADIFVTTRLDDTWTNWSEPINLGPVINSPEWDGYITIPASGEYAYFSSSKNSIGSDDIFKVKLFPAIKPQIVNLFDFQFKDKATQSLLLPITNIQMLETGKDTMKVNAPVITFEEETSTYKTILVTGKKYQLIAKIDGYGDLNTVVDLTKETRYKEIKKIFDLLPMVQGQKIVLQNLLFDQGSAVIREESFEELGKIKSIMQDNPTMEILLEGHTDNQGDMFKNIKLAEDRVLAVKKYLSEVGNIDPSRIKIKSWGPYKPVIRNSSEESRKKNRRVEFSIIKM
ncbi:MAG: OmpA family protein [Cytophagaceae bacterium]|nr:OmpA family protein [Cytophagaceae bacterium]MBK9932826.1 OmpA family protein [Cytophagaceae bacterium]MBL0303483.1 OmpA family protein [Cytophagaceae bacterium]MBL0326309.1 OmpA family protein [Cytophagaceae bacterium]